MANTEENAVVRKSVARQASDLCDKVARIYGNAEAEVTSAREKHMQKVRALEAEIPDVMNLARLKNLNRGLKLIDAADKEVQAAYFRLIGGKDGEE